MKIVFIAVLLIANFAFSSPLTGVDGPKIKKTISSFKSPVIVNFWATWCGPCKEEFPVFLKVRKDFEKKGLKVVLVSMDFPSQKKTAQEFLKSQKVDFETYFREGEDHAFINSVLPEWSGVLPTTAIFDSNGKLVHMIQGVVDESGLKEHLKKVIK
jgi:thiol-disulfide isomerase/thioredoxin